MIFTYEILDDKLFIWETTRGEEGICVELFRRTPGQRDIVVRSILGSKIVVYPQSTNVVRVGVVPELPESYPSCLSKINR